MDHFAPDDISSHKFYEETLWSGTRSWCTIQPTHRILTFSAREVIMWMGKTIAKFSLRLTRMPNFRCITRKCFVPDTVPRNSGAFQSNRWKPSSQEPNQSALCHLSMNPNCLLSRRQEGDGASKWTDYFPNLSVDYLDCRIFTAKFQSQEISSSSLLDASLLSALTC